MNNSRRIQNCFNHGKVLVGYLTAGDGGVKHTLAAAMALIKGGITMLEIGMPFSDPLADGPVIQRASTRALQAGTTLNDIFWLTQQIRQQSDIPLILFSYLNPLLAQFNSSLFTLSQQSGIDGILLVDCPIEESEIFRQKCIAHQISPIFVITPSTSLARLQEINAKAKGFLYYACRKGTTGIQTSLPADFAEKMQTIKKLVTNPVVVGFGISQRKTVEEVLQYADGVVIGSAFVKALEEGISLQTLSQLTRDLNPCYSSTED